MTRRVAVISYHSSPLVEPGSGDAGGMTVYVRAVARALGGRDFLTDIFTRSTSGEVEIGHLGGAARVIGVPAGPAGSLPKDELPRFVDDFATAVDAFAAGDPADYDILHSHYWQSGLAAKSIASTWGVPWVHSQHTLARVKDRAVPPGEPPETESRIRGEEAVIAAADILIASTEEERRQLGCLYGASPDRIKTVYPGVDHDLFHPDSRSAARRKLGVAQDSALLLCVGRIQPLKGLDLAIAAMAELVPALDRDVNLGFVGGASGDLGQAEISRLRTLAADAGVADHVLTFGPQRHEETPDFYRAADAVLVCSYSESFGLSALEAHASGVPVVGSAVGGLAHVVRSGKSGFLVDDRDPSRFAGHLKTLLSDPDFAQRCSLSAVRSARRFTWERTARELAELYECLVEEGLPEVCTC